MDFKRVNRDINGNPRYVFHFLDFVNDQDKKKSSNINQLYDLALAKSREIGGKKYRGKDFGGGIVFQSYNIHDTIKRIKEVKNK